MKFLSITSAWIIPKLNSTDNILESFESFLLGVLCTTRCLLCCSLYQQFKLLNITFNWASQFSILLNCVYHTVTVHFIFTCNMVAVTVFYQMYSFSVVRTNCIHFISRTWATHYLHTIPVTNFFLYAPIIQAWQLKWVCEIGKFICNFY